MKKRVKVVFDRKGTAKKTEVGKVELQVYLSWTQRKWITVGTSTPDEWEVLAQSTKIRSKIMYYEGIIKAMEMLDEEMNIENFNKHTMIESDASTKNNAHFYIRL